MANEIIAATSVSGSLMYALIRNTTAEVWSVFASAYETYVTANINNYCIPMAEQGTASRVYAADMPGVPPGVLYLTVYQRIGSDFSETDPLISSFVLQWDGVDVLGLDELLVALVNISGRIPVALESGFMSAKVDDFSAGALITMADGFLDRAAGVEAGFTLREGMRLMLAAMAGKVAGAGTTTVVIRAANDLKPRITATVTSQGNRTSLVLDAS